MESSVLVASLSADEFWVRRPWRGRVSWVSVKGSLKVPFRSVIVSDIRKLERFGTYHLLQHFQVAWLCFVSLEVWRLRETSSESVMTRAWRRSLGSHCLDRILQTVSTTVKKHWRLSRYISWPGEDCAKRYALDLLAFWLSSLYEDKPIIPVKCCSHSRMLLKLTEIKKPRNVLVTVSETVGLIVGRCILSILHRHDHLEPSFVYSYQ